MAFNMGYLRDSLESEDVDMPDYNVEDSASMQDNPNSLTSWRGVKDHLDAIISAEESGGDVAKSAATVQTPELDSNDSTHAAPAVKKSESGSSVDRSQTDEKQSHGLNSATSLAVVRPDAISSGKWTGATPVLSDSVSVSPSTNDLSPSDNQAYSSGHHYHFHVTNAVQKPSTTATLSAYLQLIFGGCCAVAAVFIASTAFKVFWFDVGQRVLELKAHRMADIVQCTKEYIENDCRIDIRPPALHAECTAWEKCMDSDPEYISTSKVVASLIGEVVNEFLLSFSSKTVIVIVFILVILLGLASFVASGVRALRGASTVDAAPK